MPPLLARHFERLRRRPQIERRWLNRNHHEPGRAHREARFGLGVRRSVDQHQIRPTYPIFGPLCRAPARQCRKIETDCLCPEPRPPQFDPSREAALRIDIESRDPRAATRPGHGKLRGERHLTGAALALCNRNDQPHHSTSALAEANGGW